MGKKMLYKRVHSFELELRFHCRREQSSLPIASTPMHSAESLHHVLHFAPSQPFGFLTTLASHLEFVAVHIVFVQWHITVAILPNGVVCERFSTYK